MSQTKGLKRNTIDKFYTSPEAVIECMNKIRDYIDISKSDIVIEPSAGNGAFISEIKSIADKVYFFDIDPDHNEITKQDFLNLNYESFIGESVHVIGNPPFGRQSSMAIKFIKLCCKFATSISFILPKSFKKESMRKHFHTSFHLIHEMDIKSYSFLVNDIEYDVPCVFQIWIKKDIDRPPIEILAPKCFSFVKKNNNPDISFRRVGVNAGNVSLDTESKSEQSHYFIKLETESPIENIVSLLQKISFDCNNTVGPKSISKQELIKEFNQVL